MEKNASKMYGRQNTPPKKSFKSLLFGKETLRFIVSVLVVSFVVMCVMFVVQMSSVEPETEDTIALIGVIIITLVGLYKAGLNMRMLEGVWEKFAYFCIAAILGYLIFQLSMFLFVAFIIYLVCSFFGLAKFDLVKALFPGRSQNAEESDADKSPDYGNFHHGVTGDYIQGQNGTDLRITDDLGGGDVRTEDGQRYHIDEDGFARKR